MKMKVKILFLICLSIVLSRNVYSQKEYVIIGNPSEMTGIVYNVQEKTIKTNRYELQEVDNPKYLMVQNQIDSLNKIIETTNTFNLDNNKIANLKHAKQFLLEGIEKANNKSKSLSMDAALDAKKNKWAEYKQAKTYLDQINIPFEQNIKGKYDIATEQANINVSKIDKLIEDYKNISNARTQIRTQKSYINSSRMGENSIPEKIKDYVAVEAIERKIFLIDTLTNAKNSIDKTLLDFDNKYNSPKYYLVTKDYLGLVKNELIPKVDLESIVPYDKIREVSDFIGNYDERNNSNMQYLFKGAESGKLYYTNDNVLGVSTVERSLFDALSFLKDSGGKYYAEENNIYVEYNGHKCILTTLIKESLVNKDLSAINKMSSSVAQHKIMKDQASDLASKMQKHMDTYYSHLITSDGLAAWKNLTLQCTALIKKMGALPFADTREYYTQCAKENEIGLKYADIVDINTVSRKLLGL